MRTPHALLAAAGITLGCAVPSAQAQGVPARHDRVERAVVKKVNAVRRQHGLRRLRGTRALAVSADAKAVEVVQSQTLDHGSPDGTSMELRVRRYVHARQIAETLGFVPQSGIAEADAIVGAWMTSPFHRAALLSATFRRVGVGRRHATVAGAPVAVLALNLASAR